MSDPYCAPIPILFSTSNPYLLVYYKGFCRGGIAVYGLSHMRESVVTEEETSSEETYSTEEELIDDLVADAFVDDESGSGALSSTDDWVRANHSPHANDGRSPTRTYFDPRDVRGKYPAGQQHRKQRNKRSWRSLANWQDGVQSDISRGGQNWWADKQRWADIFADQLHASTHHEQRCKEILEKITMKPYQSAGIDTEVVIVGILSLLIDSDITDFENRTLARDGTKDLLDDLESDVSEFESVRKKLKKHDKDIIFP